MNGLVGVQLFDLRDQLFLGHVLRQNELLNFNADQLSAGNSALLVGQVRRILANAENTQLGADALSFSSATCACSFAFNAAVTSLPNNCLAMVNTSENYVNNN